MFWLQKTLLGIKKHIYIIEGSLEVKIPTTWTDGKAEVGRVRYFKRRDVICLMQPLRFADDGF